MSMREKELHKRYAMFELARGTAWKFTICAKLTKLHGFELYHIGYSTHRRTNTIVYGQTVTTREEDIVSAPIVFRPRAEFTLL